MPPSIVLSFLRDGWKIVVVGISRRLSIRRTKVKPDELIEKARKIYDNSADWTEPIADLMPEMLESWITIRQKVADDGALTRKVKEFILIGINLVRGYPSGIENHMKKAIELGATQQEIMEVIATAVISSAAPSIMNGAKELSKLTQKS
jgi:AhpD family alkylhydroperoxidase